MQFKDIKYVTEDGKLDGKLYFNVTVVMDDGTEIPYSYLDTEEDTSMVANIIREGLKNKLFELPKEFPIFEKDEQTSEEILKKISDDQKFEKEFNDLTTQIEDIFNHENTDGYIWCISKPFSICDYNLVNLLCIKELNKERPSDTEITIKDHNDEDVTVMLSEIDVIINEIVVRRNNVKKYYTSMLNKLQNCVDLDELHNISWDYDEIEANDTETNIAEVSLDELKAKIRNRFIYERKKELEGLVVDFDPYKFEKEHKLSDLDNQIKELEIKKEKLINEELNSDEIDNQIKELEIKKEKLINEETCSEECYTRYDANDGMLALINSYLYKCSKDKDFTAPICTHAGEVIDFNKLTLEGLLDKMIEERENVLIKYTYYFNNINYAQSSYELEGLE